MFIVVSVLTPAKGCFQALCPSRAAYLGGIDKMMVPLFPLVFMVASALLTAGKTGLTMLPDSAVKKMASSAYRSERRIARLLERPSTFMNQVKMARFACTVAGSVSLYAWIFLEAALPLLRRWAQASLTDTGLWLALVLTLALTILLLHVLCVLLPYRVACRHPLSCSTALAGFCRFFGAVFSPFAWLNNRLAVFLSLLFGAHTDQQEEQVTEEEIRMMVDVGEEKGTIEQSEKDMINNIFEFDDRCVSEVMTHRTEMIAVPKTISLPELTNIATASGYSRIPVYDEDVDNIRGIIYVKDLLRLLGNPQEAFEAEKIMRTALFVPENMSCVDLFALFKAKKVQVAIAVDEYGGTAGIVSMEDLLESIVGNIQDEYDNEEEEISKLGENCYSIDGAVSVEEVERLFGVSLDEEEEFDTVSGLLIERLQHIPSANEHPCVDFVGLRFTVLVVEDRRIARVRVERLSPEPEGDPKPTEPVS